MSERVRDGKFFDSDGSIVVLPPDACVDLDDDCALDERMTAAQRIRCARYDDRTGRCPFMCD